MKENKKGKYHKFTMFNCGFEVSNTENEIFDNC